MFNLVEMQAELADQVQVEAKVRPEIQEGQDSKDKAAMQEEREEQDR